jgi:hypothetical protein
VSVDTIDAPALREAAAAAGPLDNRFHIVACQRVIQIRNGLRPRLEQEGRLAMPELHPTRCACRDCRNRRLIGGTGPAEERYGEDELEDFGHLLRQKGASQAND